MDLQQLSMALNSHFNIQMFNAQEWAERMSRLYANAMQRFIQPQFPKNSWNGLMLDNASESKEIDRVYLAVFPSQDILDMIIAREVERGAPGTVVFTHYPLNYNTETARFEPIGVEQFEEMKEHNISLYVCHVPLDCHPEISTSNALAEALELQDLVQFGNRYGGKVGTCGTTAIDDFQEFAEQLATICELPQLRYDQCRFNGRAVRRVAIAPGWIPPDQILDDAVKMEADTFVSGQWWFTGTDEQSQQQRETLRNKLDSLQLNLLGTSLYSSDFVVIRDQLPAWFRKQNIEPIVLREDED